MLKNEAYLVIMDASKLTPKMRLDLHHWLLTEAKELMKRSSSYPEGYKANFPVT